MPERTVCDIRPLGARDGSDGYVVTHERSGAWLRRDRHRVTARGVIVAAGALGTNKLLFSCKLRGSLPGGVSEEPCKRGRKDKPCPRELTAEPVKKKMLLSARSEATLEP
jgi:hypothetical protein